MDTSESNSLQGRLSIGVLKGFEDMLEIRCRLKERNPQTFATDFRSRLFDRFLYRTNRVSYASERGRRNR